MESFADRVARIEAQITAATERAGRSRAEVDWIAVSKTVDPAQVRAAHAAGVRRFGESRAQELAAKRAALGDLELEWHFIGHVQTNKVREVLPLSSWIHSVDRLKLARKLAAQVPAAAPQRILVQVNTSGEASKSGVSPAGLPELLDALAAWPQLRVEGLMTIGPLTDDQQAIRAAFRTLRHARDRERARQRPGAPLGHLSMGMSGDFPIAIEEGATLLRIGTAFFGARP